MNRSYLNPNFVVERRPEKWPKPAVLPSLELRQPTLYFEADLPLKLRQSKYMLVVPNRHTSVYTRLWCGYEAYLGFAHRILVGGLEHEFYFSIYTLGISLSQLTNSYFLRAVGQPPTRKRFEKYRRWFVISFWFIHHLGNLLKGPPDCKLVSTNPKPIQL